MDFTFKNIIIGLFVFTIISCINFGKLYRICPFDITFHIYKHTILRNIFWVLLAFQGIKTLSLISTGLHILLKISFIIGCIIIKKSILIYVCVFLKIITQGSMYVDTTYQDWVINITGTCKVPVWASLV